MANEPEQSHSILQNQEKSLTDKVIDGVKGFPGVLGATGASYILNFESCVPRIAEHVPADAPNFGFHLAVGSGLYGGYTDNDNRKIGSLVTLGLSLLPEAAMLAQSGDLELVAKTGGAKLAGYAIGYVAGWVVNQA